MNNLTIINHNGQFVIDSREVAEMVGKEHKNLLRDIKGYVDILTSSNLSPLEFFIESTYQDAKGETRPCYLLTRKGCDMVANKLTGEKGVLFTAAYVAKFEEMERMIKTQSISNTYPLSQAKALLLSNYIMRADKMQLSALVSVWKHAGIDIDLTLAEKGNYSILKIRSFPTQIENYFRESSPRGIIPAGEMYQDYLSWCNRNNILPVSRKAFSLAIQKLGVKRGRTSKQRFYIC